MKEGRKEGRTKWLAWLFEGARPPPVLGRDNRWAAELDVWTTCWHRHGHDAGTSASNDERAIGLATMLDLRLPVSAINTTNTVSAERGAQNEQDETGHRDSNHPTRCIKTRTQKLAPHLHLHQTEPNRTAPHRTAPHRSPPLPPPESRTRDSVPGYAVSNRSATHRAI